MHSHLHIAPGCSSALAAEINTYDDTVWPTKPKINTYLVLTRKGVQAPVLAEDVDNR